MKKILAAFLIAHIFSWYVKMEKYHNPPPGFSFIEIVMCLQARQTQAQTRALSPNSCLSLHPEGQTHKLYWAELSRMCMAISKAWQNSAWPESAKAGPCWAGIATLSSESPCFWDFLHVAALRGEEEWLGLGLCLLQCWYCSCLKNTDAVGAHISDVSFWRQVFFQEYLTLRQSQSKILLPALWGYL